MHCDTQNESIHSNDSMQPAVKSCSGQENPMERHNVNLCDGMKAEYTNRYKERKTSRRTENNWSKEEKKRVPAQ